MRFWSGIAPQAPSCMLKHPVTRLLHAVLAVAVLHQLVVSIWMQAPRPHRPENFAFELHEYGGLATFGIVLTFWIWVFWRRADTAPGALFPWFSQARRVAFIEDLRTALQGLRQLRLPEAVPQSPLANAVDGLGLLAVLAVATSGTGWWLLETASPAAADLIREVHHALSTLVWIFLVGHAGIALLHELTGHPVLRRMFPFGRRGDLR